MAEGPRLYSRQPNIAADVVAPQHEAIHADLERWGAWSRERRLSGHCASAEHRYDETGGRTVRRPVIALPPDPRMQRIERAVLSMPVQHGETLKLYYVVRMVPGDPDRKKPCICRLLAIHWRDWPVWIGDCRSMVLNILRSHGS